MNPADLAHFSGSYRPEDVHILLKPAIIPPVAVAEKERLIQTGARHYSEMLSAEEVPDPRYLQLYDEALRRNAGRLRRDIDILADGIMARPATRTTCVIVSLARAGTPVGVLLKRALQRRGVIAHHYSISIIRGRGIDRNALRYIAARHGSETTVFVDGWTGKGAIRGELDRTLGDGDTGFEPFLAVVADPAGCADLAATCDDYVIPSGLLNGIVSGLISRSVLNDAIVGPDDFHACVFQQQHAAHDISQGFIDAVETAPDGAAPDSAAPSSAWSRAGAARSRRLCAHLIRDLMHDAGVDDINRIKPGIAESTRAILRRVPHRVYIHDPHDCEVQHILHLARLGDIEVIQRDLYNYRAVTIIRKIRGDQE